MEQKRCSTCHDLLPVEAFAARRASADGRQARCRACWRAWYLANKEEHVRRVGLRNEQARQQHRRRLVEHLAEHPCVDCGESDLRVLDFDHVDPDVKESGIARLSAMHVPWSRVAAEIAKCSVRCANCHRKRTAEQLGYWRQTAELQRQAEVSAQAHERLSRLDLVGDSS